MNSTTTTTSDTINTAIRAASLGLYRTAVKSSRIDGAGTTVSVECGSTPTVYSSTNKVWHKRNTWSATAHTVRYVVREDWAVTVGAADLAVVEGLLTLRADVVDAPAGVEAWSATWVAQGRGLDRKAVTGVIVRRDGIAVHGATVALAIRAIRRAIVALAA
jgi:hypothetical protein